VKFRSLLTSALPFVVIVSATALAADVESLPGGPAPKKQIAQKCLDDIEVFERELWRIGFGVLPPKTYPESASPGYSDFFIPGVPPTPRKQMRALRDAATVYAFEGDEQSCQRMLSSMREVYQGHQKLVGSEADSREARTAWRRAHLARAVPVTGMKRLMRADIVIGGDLRNAKDEKLGEITDIVLDPERKQVAYVLVARGGFLGIGQQLRAVRWADLRATDDHEIYLLDVAPTALDNAPAVDRKNFAQTADASWRDKLDAYWGNALKRR